MSFPAKSLDAESSLALRTFYTRAFRTTCFTLKGRVSFVLVYTYSREIASYTSNVRLSRDTLANRKRAFSILGELYNGTKGNESCVGVGLTIFHTFGEVGRRPRSGGEETFYVRWRTRIELS